MSDKKLLYTSEDDFSLYIQQDGDKFVLSLFDNQSKLEYNLADYTGDTYCINLYNQDKFEKYFLFASKTNKLIKHNMISYIRSVNNTTTDWNRILRIIKIKTLSLLNKLKITLT